METDQEFEACTFGPVEWVEGFNRLTGLACEPMGILGPTGEDLIQQFYRKWAAEIRLGFIPKDTIDGLRARGNLLHAVAFHSEAEANGKMRIHLFELCSEASERWRDRAGLLKQFTRRSRQRS